jgi:hypothetical protein
VVAHLSFAKLGGSINMTLKSGEAYHLATIIAIGRLLSTPLANGKSIVFLLISCKLGLSSKRPRRIELSCPVARPNNSSRGHHVGIEVLWVSVFSIINMVRPWSGDHISSSCRL